MIDWQSSFTYYKQRNLDIAEVKSNSNGHIPQCCGRMNLHFDASSGYEVKRAIHAGVPAERISLSTQVIVVNIVHFRVCNDDLINRVVHDKVIIAYDVRTRPCLHMSEYRPPQFV